MSNKVWLGVVVLGSLVACATKPPVPAVADPPRCTDTLPADRVTRVYVEVAPAPGGAAVTPEWCVVRSGTEVVWCTPAAMGATFALDFAESPGVLSGGYRQRSAGEKHFTSHRVGDRQELAITTRPVTAIHQIRYDVRIGGAHIDPGIKIMPR